MKDNVIRVTFPQVAQETKLNAATEWVLAELDGEPASIESMRAVAEKELKRPRSPLHAGWARAFLEETEQYVGGESA